MESGPPSDPTPTRSLYEELGGERAVAAVVDDFVNRAANDPRVNFTRRGTPAEWQATPENVAGLKRSLAQFIAQATGGPRQYSGRDMPAAHRGMKITDAEFDALGADLKATLDKFQVPAEAQKALLAVVETTRKDIVGQ
jgi:hemoglobin